MFILDVARPIFMMLAGVTGVSCATLLDELCIVDVEADA